MKSLLIKDTTTEERIEIVKNALNFGGADCEGIDMDDMYDDYIFGLRELAEINLEFSERHAGEIKADSTMERPHPRRVQHALTFCTKIHDFSNPQPPL